MATKLVCWKCGGSLREVPMPIRRHSLCPHCRSDLHVCRMCRHYTRRYIGECDHDRAERVLDKTAANFCSYFRPRPDAHAPLPEAAEAEKANEALSELFGIDAGAREGAPDPAGRPDTGAAEKARRELDSLFGIDPGVPEAPEPEPEPEPREPGSGKDPER